MSQECNTVETLNRLEKQIADLQGNILSQKNVLTFSEAAHYTGFSKSYLYKLTSLEKIPFSKPAGKMIFFDRAILEKWLLNNQTFHEEIENAASTYVTLNKRGGRS
jgi:excisionase family DNA binding protein